MREPGFWWQKPGLLSALLWPASALYGAVAAFRMRRAGTRAGIPVICVGNFTLGGTGKTPAAIAIAKLLAAQKERPFFLTRGYGGRLEGPLLVDPKIHASADVGDEPLLLARMAPTVVARDRVQGAALAQSAGASVVVMDDGLQNPALAKDLAIAVVDARRGFGNARVFPAGPLRAPLRQQFSCVQAMLLVGKGAGERRSLEFAGAHGCKVMRAQLEPSAAALRDLPRRKVYAFAGIGDPEKFFVTLSAAGIEASVEESFPDHHPYAEAEAARILERCAAQNLLPLTTEKDLVRLAKATGTRARLADAARALPVTLVADEALGDLVRSAIARRRRPA